MVRPLGASAVAIAIGLCVPAVAAESLVGTWATPGRCGRPLSTVDIRPMGFSGEDFFCDFKSVDRQGNTVRWRGQCTFGADREAATVTARLAKGMLSYRINRDGWNGPLQRCR
ncbi:hypothetical protein [Chelatococcus reniformis]|uniref:DUF2147 domain-containing protein n=1 Tax=Chelatococcus reniformis TaxID=1494448 RepID=A0A916UNI0_9HYPH|nr:hypothetical protein [Chelatococcus reniformis]GGC78727.1 hypothetical protein GCM10010994_41100 [Chelatococcus reniformis]